MLSKDELDKLRADHPQGIVHLIGKTLPGAREPAWECVFRAPNRNEYKMYRANAHNRDRVADAGDALAIQTNVYPGREAFQALIEKFPAIPEALTGSDDLKAITGLATEEGAKT